MEADDTPYHIRRAAQRVAVIRAGMLDANLEPTFSRPEDHQRFDSDA